MPVPANIAALSTTAGSNSPPGSEAVTTVDDYIRAHASFIAQLRDDPVTDSKLADSAVIAAKLDTTAVVRVLEAAYPIGSIYINASSATNPATLLGFGTWVAFGAGRVMVGQDTGDASFNVLEETGGSKDAVVVSHSHTLTGTTNTTGEHQHGIAGGTFGAGGGGAYYSGASTAVSSSLAGNHAHTISGTADLSGVSETNANLQPYIVVCMWKRTV